MIVLIKSEDGIGFGLFTKNYKEPENMRSLLGIFIGKTLFQVNILYLRFSMH